MAPRKPTAIDISMLQKYFSNLSSTYAFWESKQKLFIY